MALKIRLKRIGKKKSPYYRVVVQDQEAATAGLVLEELGTYNPRQQETAVLKTEAIKKWLDRGAKTSDTVTSILQRAKLNPASPAKN